MGNNIVCCTSVGSGSTSTRCMHFEFLTPVFNTVGILGAKSWFYDFPWVTFGFSCFTCVWLLCLALLFTSWCHDKCYVGSKVAYPGSMHFKMLASVFNLYRSLCL